MTSLLILKYSGALPPGNTSPLYCLTLSNAYLKSWTDVLILSLFFLFGQ